MKRIIYTPKASRSERNMGKMFYWLGGKEIKKELYDKLEKENENRAENKKHKIAKGMKKRGEIAVSAGYPGKTILLNEGECLLKPKPRLIKGLSTHKAILLLSKLYYYGGKINYTPSQRYVW